MLNAKWMIDDLRDGVDESVASHWSDAEILRKLNQSQRRLAMLLSMTVGDWLVTSEDLTPSNGVITLPAKCSKPVYLEEKATGAELPLNITVRERAQTRIPGAIQDTYGPSVYMKEGALVVNQSGYAKEVILWYEKRIPDLIGGKADTGSTTNSLVIPLGSNPRLVDDHYNGVYLEATGGSGVGTRAEITDYTYATRALTVDGSWGADTEFGTISELPEEAIPYMQADALKKLLAKPSAHIDTKYFEFALSNWREEKKTFEEWISTRFKASNRIRFNVEY